MAAQLNFNTGDYVTTGSTGTSVGGSLNFSKSSLSNMVVGDLLVAWIHAQPSAALTITPPSGWIRYGAPYGAPNSSVTRNTSFYYFPIKTATDIVSMPSTLTWTFSDATGRVAGIISRATGIDLDNIEDVASANFTGAGSTTLSIASITTVKATTLLVGGLHHQNAVSTNSPTTTSFMSSYVEYKTSPTGSANANTGIAMGYQYLTSAGPSPTANATFDSALSAGGGETVAFKAGAWAGAPITRPTIVGTPTTYTTSTASVSFSINKPSGVVDGDVLIMALSGQSATATSDFVSSGWSRVSQPFVASSGAFRIMAFYALPIPTAASIAATTFTFTATDSATGGRIAAEMFIVRGADLSNLVVGTSPYGTTSGQAVSVQATTPTTSSNLLLVAYGAQFTSTIDYTIASGPAGMTQQAFIVNATGAVSKTPLAVYQQNIEAGTVGVKTLTWNGVQSQTTGTAIILKAAAVAVPNPGIAIKYTSAPDTLSTAHLYYTSETNTLSTPLEVRPVPTGYSSVSAMLASTPFYCAHRGGSANWPEMSLHAYTQSAFWGVGALELSLARTSDGVWFGLHDATLDRTSGTTNFTPSAHTWAEVQAYQITAAGTTNTSQPARPYMRWEELMAAYYTTHVIFVDPKVASAYTSELLNMMDAMPGTPTERFVGKYYGVAGNAANTTGWAHDLAVRGYKSWGYFYQADASNFATYQGRWDILGMDYGADQASWTAILSYGKPVIGHIVPSLAAATTALNFGAAGLMASGVQQAVPRKP
jgi:hypothetical protein